MNFKKSKIIFAILFFIGILAILQGNVSATSELYYGDWTYEINQNKVEITSYNGTDTIVTIPNSINGYPVASIGYEAFEEKTQIKTLDVPTNVEEINNWAFSGCNFTTVKFANDCKVTTFMGFRDMTNLTSINIPNNVTTIDSHALANCKSLKSITIPSKVTKIGYDAFANCTGLTTITIPTNVEELDNWAFSGCNFTTVKFASDCKITAFCGFRDMTNLTSINIPNNVTTIDSHALANCKSLKSITIPSKVIKIGYDAFANCTGLTTILIPNNVKEIDKWASSNSGEDTTIYCYSNSYALSYAKAQKLKYKRIDNIEDYTITGISNKTYNGKNITFNIALKQRNITLRNGTDYKIEYKNNKNTGKASVIITGKGNYKGKVTKNFYIVPKKVTGFKVKEQKTDSIKLSWSKVTGKTGYKIYSYNYKKEKWEYVGKTDKTTYTIKKLKAGTTYKFRVRAYVTVSKKDYFGSYTSSLKTTTQTKKPSISKLTTKSKKSTIKWKKISGASGYQIYMATSKKGKYSRIKTITKGSTTSYTKSKLKKNRKYYFKIRAYRTVDGKKVYSSYSSVKSIKIK